MFVFTDIIKRDRFDDKMPCCPSHPGLGVGDSKPALESEFNLKSKDLVKLVVGGPVVRTSDLLGKPGWKCGETWI